VIGHESLGEVVEVGSAVKNVKPGDVVVPMVRRPCHHDDCMSCAGGEQDFCYTGDFTERGIKGAHGFMTEFVVDDAVYMNRVSRKLREVAVLIEPLTIAEKSLIQLWQVQKRLPWVCHHVGAVHRHHRARATDVASGGCHSAVVLGAGPVGLLGAMAFAAQGFDTYVYSRSSNPTSAEIVKAIGGTFISAEDHTAADMANKVGRIDVVYEAVGASQLAFEVVQYLGPNGVFIFTGVPGRRGPISVDTDRIMRNLVLNNQILLGSVNAGHDAFAGAIRDLGVFMERWPEAVRKLLTGRYRPEDHLSLLTGKPGGIKNVVSFGA
jgi:threonine dehydrogenase-like Zn-dependent dehydrogenase